MRKAVAVPYIIAILLGVAVIGLVGVWFVSSGGKLSKASLDADCRTEAVKLCTKSVSTGRKPSLLEAEYPDQCGDISGKVTVDSVDGCIKYLQSPF